MQRFVLACLIAAAMIPALAARVNKADNPASPTLQLTVRTDQHTYRMSDKVRMETQLLNTGNEDVYTFGNGICAGILPGDSRCT